MNDNLPHETPGTPTPAPVTTPTTPQTNNTEPAGTKSTESAGTNDSTFDFSENSVMAALSYFGPLVVIPYLTKKGNPFVHFHIKQGLVLLALWVALWIIDEVIHLYSIISLLKLGLIILSIVGIVYALQKKEKELPLVGQFASYIKI